MMMAKVSPLLRTRYTLSNNGKALFMMSSDNKKIGSYNSTEDKARTNTNASENELQRCQKSYGPLKAVKRLIGGPNSRMGFTRSSTGAGRPGHQF